MGLSCLAWQQIHLRLMFQDALQCGGRGRRVDIGRPSGEEGGWGPTLWEVWKAGGIRRRGGRREGYPLIRSRGRGNLDCRGRGRGNLDSLEG